MVAVFAGDAFLKTTVDSGGLFIGESEIFRLVSDTELSYRTETSLFRSPQSIQGIRFMRRTGGDTMMLAFFWIN